MSAIELNRQAVEQLGVGDSVAPREALKAQLVALLRVLDGQAETAANLGDEERASAFLEAISDELESILAVAAPLIEYGGSDGQEAVVRGLAQVAGEISREASLENAMYLVTARLLWSTTAFALSCDAADFLPRLLRLTVRSAFRDADVPLIDDSSARHPQAFGRGADVAFESHRLWLESLNLITERYPLLVREQQLERALAEADLIFALHTDAADMGIRGTYSHAAHREGHAEQRLRARARTPSSREQLVRFFGIPDDHLEERLAELHEGFPRQRNLLFGDVRLFPAGD
jgi:hypothetical protein